MTFREVLNRAPSVPVVVLSGRDDEQLAIKAIHQGAQDYLVKGQFDGRQLGRTIRYAVERQTLLTSLDLSKKEQLQFKDQVLSNVAHELRAPLACAHQFATILLDELAGPIASEQRDHLNTILRSMKQLGVMIGDLIDATRAESGKTRIEPRCFVIGEVVQRAIATLRVTAEEKGIRLNLRLDARIPFVWIDPDRVLQALINLIDNAIKFTPPGKSILVEARLMDLDPEYVYVSVEDSGSGIRPEAKGLIFERLFQAPDGTDGSPTGLGLGLYITKELIRLHGGRIWVESQPGYGSTFSFTLPLFSVAKLLFPVVTNQGQLRKSIMLIVVQIAPRFPLRVDDWKVISRLSLEQIRLCVLPDKNAIMPARRHAGQAVTFLIVASTDEDGIKVQLERIRAQLRRCDKVKANCVLKVSARPVVLPSRQTGDHIETLVQRVASTITEMAMGIGNAKVGTCNQSPEDAG